MKSFSFSRLKKEFKRIRWPHAKDDQKQHEKGYISTFLEVIIIILAFVLFFVVSDALLSILLKNVTFKATTNNVLTGIMLFVSSVAIILTLLQTDKADNFQNVFGANKQLSLFVNTKERGTDKIFPTATAIILFLFISLGFLSLIIGG